MSFLGPVGGFVREIVSNTVVQYAVLWLSEFVSQKIHPLWQRYWPVIYQSILVPAYHLVSDTIQPLLHDLRSNHGDSSAVSASESPPGGTSAVTAAIFTDPADMEAEMNHPQVPRLILERAAAQARSSTSATRAPAGGTSATTAKDLITAAFEDPHVWAAVLSDTRVQDVLQRAAAQARSSTSATRAPAGGTSATTAKDLITAAFEDPHVWAAVLSDTRVQDVLQKAAAEAGSSTSATRAPAGGTLTGMRGMTARNELRFRRQTKAAIIIQSHCRKYLARLHYMKLKKAARSELRKLKMAVTAAIFTDPADMEAEMNHPQVPRLILEEAAAIASYVSATRTLAGWTSAVTAATTAKDLITAAGLGAAALRYTRVQDVLQEAAPRARRATKASIWSKISRVW